MLTTQEILDREQFFIKWSTTYMAPADMVKHPRMTDMHRYLETRQHFACQLSWSADIDTDEAYSNQVIGIVADSFYAVITHTATGIYCQTTAEEFIKLDSTNHFQTLRTL